MVEAGKDGEGQKRSRRKNTLEKARKERRNTRARQKNKETVTNEKERKENGEEEQEEHEQNGVQGCKQEDHGGTREESFEVLQTLLGDHRGAPLRTSRCTFLNNKVA